MPGDFDTVSFLKQAKEQFVRIQAVWDSGETDRLREFLTDDLIVEPSRSWPNAAAPPTRPKWSC